MPAKRKSLVSMPTKTKKDAVKRKSPDSVLTENEMDAVKKNSPGSILSKKEKDAVERKSPDCVPTQEELDAFSAYYERVTEEMKMNRERVRLKYMCKIEDPEKYFSKATGLEALLWEEVNLEEQWEKEDEEELRAEKEEELRAEEELRKNVKILQNI